MKSPVQQTPKKGSVKHLLEMIVEMKEQLNAQRDEMRRQIEAEFVRNYGDKSTLINDALNETIIQKEILIAKGLMTREEINAKYAELKGHS